jgi:hypothetical protein
VLYINLDAIMRTIVEMAVTKAKTVKTFIANALIKNLLVKMPNVYPRIINVMAKVNILNLKS